MKRANVADRVRQAIGDLRERAQPVSLATICEQVRQTGGRISHTSIIRNKDAKALYVAHRTWRSSPKKRFRGYFRDATDFEVKQACLYMAKPKITLVAILLAHDAKIRFLTTEVAAYRAMERRGDLVAPLRPIDHDQEIAGYHQLLARRREYMTGYRPALLREIEGGHSDAP